MKINYKLINLALLVFILYLIIQTSSYWTPILIKLFSILIPILIAFTIAYALYPLTTFLQSKRVSKSLSLVIALGLVIGVLSLVIFTAFPLIFNQLTGFFNSIVKFFTEISNEYDVSFGSLQETLSKSFNEIILSFSKYVSDGAVTVIGVSFSYISNFVIILAASIYFLIDMDKIREEIKDFLSKKSKRTLKYVKLLDDTMKTYITSYFKIAVISFIEYSLAFLIIGHPNALLLGMLIAVLELIPYFGGLFTNAIALITAFVISPALFIRTIIVFIILSILDSYVINPLVYGKTNKVHPLVVILAVFVGGALFGVLGIIIALPVALITIVTLKFYKKDIKETYEELKNK